MTLMVVDSFTEYIEAGADISVYFTMAIIATLIFVIRLVFALFFGDSGDSGDFDVDVDHAADATGDAFQLFSLLSITAFFMGAGWMGFAARSDWGLSGGLSMILALGFGAVMLLTASGLMFAVRRLSSHPTVDPQSVRGQIGRVYMQIPEHGTGKVQVRLGGSRKILPARSQSGPVASFTSVRVVEVESDGTLVVETRDEA